MMNARRVSWVAPALMVAMVTSCSDDDPGRAEASATGTGGTAGATASGGGAEAQGSGGAGAAGGGEGAHGGQGAHGGGSGGGGTCGNGLLEPGETCDAFDFGATSCETLGFRLGGKLLCDDLCSTIDSTHCKLDHEICNDWLGNDLDAGMDCDDSDCVGDAHCLDACADLHVFTIPDTPGVEHLFVNSTQGSSSIHQPSCTTASGKELVLALQSPVDGRLRLRVNGADYSLSVRTSCADPATEIACKNNTPGKLPYAVEMLGVTVTQGEIVYVMVDGVDPGDEGTAVVEVMIPVPETGALLCNDMYDDDVDGYIDCADPDCQATMDCLPGDGPIGTPCAVHADCSATGSAPLCLPEIDGWPGGYCSELCDLATPVCPDGAECVERLVGGDLAPHGVCLKTCLDTLDCAPGYECIAQGSGAALCAPAPESQCDDFADNDADSWTDCEDADCQAACTPGAGPTGAPCSATTDCSADGSDPICFGEADLGYPGGYCSQFCTRSSECGNGAVCFDYYAFPSFAGTCFVACTSALDCRPGYGCSDIGSIDGDLCVPL